MYILYSLDCHIWHKGFFYCQCTFDIYQVLEHLVREPLKSRGARVGAGAGLDKYSVVQHLVREPCKNQGAVVGAGAGLDRYRVIQHLVMKT